MRYYSNTAVEATLAAGATPSDTTIQVSAVTGFPVTFPYTLTIDPEGGSKEIVTVSGAAGTTLTVTRGEDGTTGVSHSLGVAVRHDHSARDFREPQEHIAAEADVHGVSGNLVGETNTATLTNKTIDLTSNTVTGTKAEFDTALVDGNFATLANAETLTNKTIDLASNSLSGTKAQFNTALSDGDFASQAGTETLTNKTISLGSNTLSGTKAQFDAALSDGDFATLAGAETLSNKTLASPVVTGSLTAPTYFASATGVGGGLAVNDGVLWTLEPASVTTGTGFTHSSGVFTALNTGIYLVNFGVQWAANATGYRRISIYVNGSALHSGIGSATTGAATIQNLTFVAVLAASDTIEMRVQQGSGAGLGIDNGAWRITRIAASVA